MKNFEIEAEITKTKVFLVEAKTEEDAKELVLELIALEEGSVVCESSPTITKIEEC